MDNLLLSLVIVLIVLIGIFILSLSIVGYKFLKLKEKELGQQAVKDQKISHDDVESPDTNKISIKRSAVSQDLLKALRMRQGGGHFCIDHPDEYSLGLCAISGEPYCEKCLSVQSDVKVAKKYLDIYLDNEWEEVIMLANQSLSTDMIERLVKMKEALWKEENLPLMVQGHHKINVETDDIEIYTVIFARKEDKDYIKGEISFIN
jgi:hypothetical protein